MTQSLERTSRDVLAMKSAGALAYIDAELDRMEVQLRQAPHWQPGRQIEAQISWLRGHIGEMEAAWNRKLVVALVGPSGAGKSTLLNALAGRKLSATGLDRPTTRQIVVYTQSLADLDGLWQDLDPTLLQVKTDYARALDSLILVDTPDTNTLPENQRLLAEVLRQADLLLAVFPAQNPKLQDNISFLEPFVRQLPPDAVIPIVNQVDRVDREELELEIVPDLLRLVQNTWQMTPQRVFLISARANVLDNAFVEDERPLHDLDQFAELAAYVADTLNKAEQASDRRLTRAEYLLDALREQCAELLAKSAHSRTEAAAALEGLGRQMDSTLTETLAAHMRGSSDMALHAALYGRLAPRWWGPVGWLVALWALVLRLVSSVRRLTRPRRALVQLGSANESDADAFEAPDTALWHDRLLRLQSEQWPPVADALAAAGFTELGRGESWTLADQAQNQQLNTRWQLANEQQLESLTNTLASWPLQLALNAPVLGLVIWSCVQIIQGFFMETFLPADYFRHAAIATGVVWALAFVLYQFLVTLALRRPFQRGVARYLAQHSVTWLQPISSQLQVLAELQRECTSDHN